MRTSLLALGVALLLPGAAAAQNQSLEIQKLGDGVYAAIRSEFRMDPIEGNSLLVVTSEGVVVFDTGRSPDTARRMIAEIRKLTTQPVRYVVNSHWHDDHVFGNQAYEEAFPGVQFVAHRETRADMISQSIPSLKTSGVEYWTKMMTGFEARLAKGVTSDGKPLTDAQKTRLAEQARTIREYLPKFAGQRIVLPTVLVHDALTLHLGGQEIRVLHLGLGNTRGDLVIHLPRERLVATGDLLVHPVPFAYGSFPAEWVGTLKALRALDATAIVPGHGPLMRDTAYLDLVIELLESLVAQVGDAVRRGQSLEDTRKAVDVTRFRERMSEGDSLRSAQFGDSIVRVAVESAYKAATAAPRRGPAAGSDLDSCVHPAAARIP
ncbi:MAG TPA: MBL fold metallo-hydrolase [Vicinamibacterales bacterium]|nr:MBL fold metallo-hydrolase [Vicinamibacterales bacterium]